MGFLGWLFKNMKKIKRVFDVFRENYELVPLEVFGDDKYKTLISTILSARTNDDTTLEASKRLFKKAPDISTLAKLDVEKIEELIFPVGFYKNKAKHIKETANVIIEEHDGIIPDTRSDLMKLPGVGRKTANLVLNRAFGKPAIAVDTHVHRITNLLGWVDSDKPKETEKQLVEFLPEKYWSETNKLFVSIGRQFTTKNKLVEFLKENGLIAK